MTAPLHGRLPRTAAHAGCWLALALLLGQQVAQAQDGGFFDKPDSVRLTPGQWDGRHAFQDVWCARFPDAATATGLTEGLMGNGAIYFLRVDYTDHGSAYVVTSTLPPQATARSDVETQLKRERANAAEVAAAGGRYLATPIETGFGPGVGIEIANSLASGPQGIFPVARPIGDGNIEHPSSLSVHRIFARGGNRYEVAVLGAPDPAAGTRATDELRARLMRRAVALQEALTSCTAAMQKEGRRSDT